DGRCYCRLELRSRSSIWAPRGSLGDPDKRAGHVRGLLGAGIAHFWASCATWCSSLFLKADGSLSCENENATGYNADMGTTKFFFYLAICMIPFGRLISEPIFQSAGKVVPLSFNDIALGVLIFAYCIGCFIRRQPIFSRVPDYKLILLFPMWCSISLLLNMKHYGLSLGATLFSALYLMRWVAYSFFYFVSYEIAADRSTARKVTKWVFVGGLWFALFGIAQAVFLPDFALQLHPEALP